MSAEPGNDATAASALQSAARRREHWSRMVYEHAAAGIALTDWDGHFLQCNRAYTEMLGYGQDELLDHDYAALLHPDDREANMEQLRRLKTGEVPSLEIEARYIRKDGEVVRLHKCVSILPDEVGKPTCIMSIVTDVTGHFRADEALRQRDRFITSVAEASPHVFYVFDLDTMGLSYVNRPMLRDLGYSVDVPEVNRLSSFSEYMPQEELPHLARVLDEWRVLPAGTVREDEYRLRHADGTFHFFAGRELAFSRRPDGSVRQVLGTLLDITDRKLAEDAVRASQAKLQAALASMTDAVFIADIRGQSMVEFNDAFAAFHRFHDREHCLRTLPEYTARLDMYLPDGTLATVEQWPVQRAARGETATNAEYTLRRKDTGESWVGSYSFAPVRDKDGAITGCVVAARDVTQQKQIEESLRQAQAAAEHANKAKDHFLAVLSHELRTPLAPVLASISMLQENPDHFDAGARAHLDMIQRNVEMEALLIDDLLDVTRISRGKIELHRRPVRLAEILKRAVEVVRPDMDARHLHFGADAMAAPYTVNADPARLQQVFWNLLRNAVKFTPNGGYIGIDCAEDWSGNVIVEIHDSGEGINPANLRRIFDAFEQAERSSTQQFGGLGLGLTISKALVELHGGSIEAHSDGKGKGATFRVMLPIAEAPRIAADETPTTPKSDVHTHGSLRILLVEDHGDTARIMQQLLKQRGHNVHHAADVATAVRQSGEHGFDLLICDLGLPDGSGLDLLRDLRKRGIAVPAIALSGYGQDDDLHRSHDAGFAVHLIKPVSPARLDEAIAQACPTR